MKNKFIYLTIFSFFALISLSCKKYLDINQNPNSAEEPPINGLLANTTYNTAINVFNVSNWTSYYTQYLSSPNTGSDVDTYNNVNASGTWNGIYNTMTDIYDMKRFAMAKGLNAYVGVADILMAFHINLASNVWGDIPYSQAFLGVETPTPVYDNQQALFDTAINLLNEGLAALQQPDAAGQLDENSDFIHGGDDTAWMRTAHALKARMLNQLSKTSDYDPAEILQEVSMAYRSNADDAQVTMFEVRNPWASVAIANAGLDLDGWLSSYFVNATNGITYSVFDPRLPLLAEPTKYGDYRGTPNGKGRTGTGTEHEESYLSVGGWYSDDNSPLQIITYSELMFIKAEAAFRSSDKTTAYNAYLEGIRSNMIKMGVSETDMNSYISNPAVNVGADNLTLALIFKEKYVACFLSPETWVDMRRFDYNYKDFSLPQNAVINSFIRRMNYPVVELSTNGSHVPDVQVTDKLWWDQ